MLTIYMRKMKYTILSFALFAMLGLQNSDAQVIAGTGIDGDVYSNIPNTTTHDDWFHGGAGGSNLIDTADGSVLKTFFQTASNQSTNWSFFERSAYKLWAEVNGNLYVIGGYSRDNVGGAGVGDSTVFTNGSKNGDDPSSWGTTIAGVGATKSDILDVYTAFRREGTTVQGDLWLQGAVSVIGTSGSRFFDFEYNQTKITFDQTNGFGNLGPNEGHTSWGFDINGKIDTVGDLILACEFDNTGLIDTALRMWVRRSDFNTVTPTTFTWGANFDGPSGTSIYGYADVIIPGSSGVVISNTNSAATAAPPWGAKTGKNVYVTTYSANQLLEFAVNLTAIGVDPKDLPQFNDPCLPIYNSFMAKSRASASFTAALQDFTNPIVFDIPDLDVNFATDSVGMGCLSGNVLSLTATSTAANLYSAPIYTWTTANGNITSGNLAGDSAFTQNITIDKAGKYYIGLSKYNGCPVDGWDSVTVMNDNVKPIASIFLTNDVDSLHSGNNYEVVLMGGDSAASVAATSIYFPSQGITWAWTTQADPFFPFADTKNTTVADSGTYILTVTELRNGCEDIASVGIVILPVEWLNIKAVQVNSKVEVQWSTASEINCDYYTVQKLNDLTSQWNDLGDVSGRGFTNNITSYNFVDPNPTNGVNFYRIVQYDYNGEKHTSEVVFVVNGNETNGSLSVYPNPSNGSIEINGATKVSKVILYDMFGRVILTQNQVENNLVDLTDIAAGTYYLKVFDAGQVQVLKTIIE